jgi:hypothetical protein
MIGSEKKWYRKTERGEKETTYFCGLGVAASHRAITSATKHLNTAGQETEQPVVAAHLFVVSAAALVYISVVRGRNACRHCRNSHSHGEDRNDDGLLHLEKLGMGNKNFVDLGKDDKDEWQREVCLVTVCLLRCSDGEWTSMNGGRFLYLRCKKHTDPLSLSRKHYRLIRAVICYVLLLEFHERNSKEQQRVWKGANVHLRPLP